MVPEEGEDNDSAREGEEGKDLMFYDKGSYATWGNFPSVEWILVNVLMTTNCTDNLLSQVDSWYFKLSNDHHL